MEYKMVTIPFDLETAKKINIGERVGQIVTEKGRNRAEIVYEDNSSICPLLVVIHSISVSADWFSATGKAFSSENRLLLEVPEYTTFKDGDVLSSKDGSYIFILNTHGKYLTSFYASLAAGKSLNISDNPDNFWQIRWLDKYMEGHKGFIAGGCFKNILSRERVKDIDIFFESEDDFQEAVDLFNDEKHQKEGWKFKYRNEKVCAFQKEGEKAWIEFIESEFGKPEEILRSFDFTVAKMAYYKEPKYEEKEDDYFPFSSASIVAYEYKLLYHEKFFEHLHMKRLVIDENIPFPVSTWERSYRYKGYGYNMCRETKKKLLQAIKGVNVEEEDVSLYTTGGWD